MSWREDMDAADWDAWDDEQQRARDDADGAPLSRAQDNDAL